MSAVVPEHPARRVTLLSTPGCPNVAAVQADLAIVLAEFGLAVAVEQRIGSFPSPTVLVDDRDVITGEYVGHSAAVAGCRLELPSLDQLRSALR